MTKILILLFLSICVSSSAQMIAFSDYSNYFRAYQNGVFRQLEFQRILESSQGDNILCYTDAKSDFKVFDGGNPVLLANVQVRHKISDNILVWASGPSVMYWWKGKKQQLTFFGREFEVKDSMIVYEDLRANNITAWYNGVNYPLYQLTGDLYMPNVIGENITVFKDNGSFYKIFWGGKIWDIDVWNGEIEASAGIDIMAYNDPWSRTFTTFYKGQFFEVNEMYAKKFKCGNGYVVFEDQNGNLKLWQNETITDLSNFAADQWDCKDNVVYWVENSYLKAFYNGKIHDLANFRSEEIAIKNNTIAFRNVLGGVSVFSKGILTEATLLQNTSFLINGDYVLITQTGQNPIIVDGPKLKNP
jgi:hypothetical protein